MPSAAPFALVRESSHSSEPGLRQVPGTGPARAREAQQERLRDAVRRALAHDPRIRVVDLAPDGRRLAVSVAGEGMLMVELSAMASRRTCPLTSREVDVLRAAAAGFSNAEIGQRLAITGQTVKFHLANVFRKLGVANRTEATRYACQMGIV
jgi:DNA-binding NarL/FixJ family response regulator